MLFELALLCYSRREREAESRDIRRLCRAALDAATRNILSRTSGRGYTLAGCLPARS